MNELGKFTEGFASWRKILGAVSEYDDRLKVFAEAAHEVANYITKGLDRANAADELQDIASAYLINGDPDAIQNIIGDAFADVEEPDRIDDDLLDEPQLNGHDKAPAPPPPLPYVDLAAPLREREWLITDRIPMFNITLLSGEGAIGKSIALLQLAAATVLGKDWFSTLPQFGPVLYIAAEEDEDEIRRRLEDIAAAFQSTRQQLIENGLQGSLLCWGQRAAGRA